MLYLIATPIGNLRDITLRALDVLKEVDLILCEDTRTSGVLLSHYGIETPTRSYHKHSERRHEDEVLRQLKEGRSIALISDAGTPGINDPGADLVAKCRDMDLPVTSIPGPCAPISALIQSGLSTDTFQFIGFLSKKENERKRQIIDALFYPGVTLFFESPRRMGKTLDEITAIGPKHRLAIVREMTKVHEECLMGRAEEIVQREFRGEIVVALEGHAKREPSLNPREHVEHLMETYTLSKQEAIKLSAELRGVSKKEVYSCFISDREV